MRRIRDVYKRQNQHSQWHRLPEKLIEAAQHQREKQQAHNGTKRNIFGESYNDGKNNKQDQKHRWIGKQTQSGRDGNAFAAFEFVIQGVTVSHLSLIHIYRDRTITWGPVCSI